MKVLYLCGSFPQISETFIIYEIQALLAAGVDVRVLSLHRPAEGQRSSLPDMLGFSDRIVDCPAPAAGRVFGLARTLLSCLAKGGVRLLRGLYADPDIRAGLYSRRALLEAGALLESRDWKPDILHCHFGTLGQTGALFKRLGLTRAKVTTVFHGYDISRHLQESPPDCYRALFETGDWFFAVSRFYLDRIRALGAPEGKSALLRMSIDCAAMPFRQRSRTATDPLRFVSVGRLTEKKGHEYTIRAFAKIAAARPDSPMRLDIAGGGPLLAEMEALVKSLGMEDRITLHGAVQHEEVKALLARSHIFVLPSVTAADGDMEGVPVALMEAMAQGLLTVSTFHSGIPELIEDGVSGFLVPERDVEALASVLLRTVDEPELWPPVIAAARQKVEREFSRESQIRTLQDVFQSLLRERGS